MSFQEEVKSISSALRCHAEKNPQKVYLVTGGIEYTYFQINQLVSKVCFLYNSVGILKGDVISAVIKNGVEYVLLYLASLRMGSVFNPYPYTLEAKDILRYVGNVNPKLLFCQEKHYEELKKEGHRDIFLVDGDFLDSLMEQEDQEYVDCVPSADSPACIYYSSGTTGNPKGIVFSHQNMMANISSIVRGFKFDDATVHLIVLPLGHTASINYSFLPCTLCGGTIVLTESFWKARANFWKMIKEYGVTYVELVPSILVALLNTKYAESDFKEINTLKFIGCGSSTLPKESQVEFREKYGFKVANLYGLSETGPTHVDYPLEEGWQPGSAGKPLDVNEVRIKDERGEFLGNGKIGEIVIKGDNVFTGYYKNEALYAQVVKEGWFHTGDLGYLAEDGQLFFTGRKKDLIIKGGVNISPDEIDEVLYKINKIEEAVTIGVPDEYLGEKIISFVVLKEGEEVNGEVNEGTILDFCRGELSRDKIPDRINFVGFIPKGPSGKLLRKELREQMKKPDFSEELEFAKKVAKEMGKLQLKHFRTSLKVIRKSPKEFVSNVDMECQKLAQELLLNKFPYPLLSEEKEITEIPDEGYFWIIDPIDGTHNFISGLPNFGVSIALASKDKFVMGIIHIPYFDETFYAVTGKGAFKNGEKIKVSENNQLEKSMITYDNQFYLNENVFERYQKVIKHSFTTRILGSAVYDFSLIASGRIDARIWNNTKIFDFAAGIVIVKEAGGKVTDFEGKEVNLDSKEIVASNGQIHDELIKVIKNK